MKDQKSGSPKPKIRKSQAQRAAQQPPAQPEQQLGLQASIPVVLNRGGAVLRRRGRPRGSKNKRKENADK